ncbi:MAG: DUF3108 domain-containing protein [Rhodoferax sp.]|nr:DUF3108 domain-containing protein [Rhodoferax sp.]
MPFDAGHGAAARRLALPPRRWQGKAMAWSLAVVAVLCIHVLVLQSLAQVLRSGGVGVPPPDLPRLFTTRTIEIDRGGDKAAIATVVTEAVRPIPVVAPQPSRQTSLQPLPAVPTAPGPSVAVTPITPSDVLAPARPSAPQALAPVPVPPQDRMTAATQEPAPLFAAAPSPVPTPGPPDVVGVPATRTGSEPVYDYVFPGSTRLKYEVAGLVKGFRYHVSGELQWLQDGKTYDARLEIRHFLLGSRIQTSKGQLTPRGLEPLRFGDKVRSEVAAHFQRSKGLVSFSANTPDAPLMPLAQDQLSLFVQLAAMWGGNARRFTPGMQLPFQAVGPRSSENWVFVVGQSERLRVDDRELSAIRLVRERSVDYDTRVELWLAPALDYLPARIRLTQGNDDEVDMLWSRSEKP